MTVLTNVLSLIVACIVGVGPVALLAVLQNRRDRRAQALFREVASQLPSEALRSDIVLDVRCRLFSGGATVRLDLGRAASSHIWETAARLRRGLPAWVSSRWMGTWTALWLFRARFASPSRARSRRRSAKPPDPREAGPRRGLAAGAGFLPTGPESANERRAARSHAPRRFAILLRRVADLTKGLPGDDRLDRFPRGRADGVVGHRSSGSARSRRHCSLGVRHTSSSPRAPLATARSTGTAIARLPPGSISHAIDLEARAHRPAPRTASMNLNREKGKGKHADPSSAQDCRGPPPVHDRTARRRPGVRSDTTTETALPGSRSHAGESRRFRPRPRGGPGPRQGALLGHAGGQRRRAGLRHVPLPRRRGPPDEEPGQPGPAPGPVPARRGR